MHSLACFELHGIPSTDVNPVPGGPVDDEKLGGNGTVGPFDDAPPAAPLVHTPLKWVGTVPYGQLSAEADDAMASGPRPMAAAHAPIRIPRFNVIVSHTAVVGARIRLHKNAKRYPRLLPERCVSASLVG